MVRLTKISFGLVSFTCFDPMLKDVVYRGLTRQTDEGQDYLFYNEEDQFPYGLLPYVLSLLESNEIPYDLAGVPELEPPPDVDPTILSTDIEKNELYDHQLMGVRKILCIKNCLIECAPGCFTGDTKISLLNGTEVAIQDLVGVPEFWVYSCTPDGRIVPGRGHSARKTKTVNEICVVTLDNGLSERCTSDHRFMLRDGTYKEAKDLTKGQSLMPLYRGVTNRNDFPRQAEGYETVYHPGCDRWQPTHRVVCEDMFVSDIFDLRRGKGTCHHDNHDKRNNCPDNLRILTKKEHDKHHLIENTTSKCCAICGKSCGNRGALAIHKILQHPVTAGDFEQRRLLGLARKLSVVSRNSVEVVCGICGVVCGNSASLGKHIRISHLHLEETACGTCGLVLKSACALGRHKKLAHPSTTDDFDYKEKLSEQRKRNNQTSVVCQYCGFACNGLGPLGVHLKVFHRKEKLHSDSGRLAISSKIRLLNSLPVLCPHCGKAFGNLGALGVHKKCKHILVNHKVVSVEFVLETCDVYDITVDNEQNTHNFALTSGVYSSNSGKTEVWAAVLKFLNKPSITILGQEKHAQNMYQRLLKRGIPNVGYIADGEIKEHGSNYVAISDTVYSALKKGNSEIVQLVKSAEILGFDECLAYETRVLLPDNTTVRIGDIVSTEKITHVMSYDVERRVYEPKRITKYIKSYSGSWYLLNVGGKSVRATHHHKFYTQNRGYVSVGDLVVGDVLVVNETNPKQCELCICGAVFCEDKHDCHICVKCNTLFGTLAEYRRHLVLVHQDNFIGVGSQVLSDNPEIGRKVLRDIKLRPEYRRGVSERMKLDNPVYKTSVIESVKRGIKVFYDSHPEKLAERKKNWMQAPYRGKQHKDRHPTKLEKFVIDMGLGNLAFVGSGDFWVSTPSGRHMNPDFKVRDRRAVVEVCDTEYWHTVQDMEERVRDWTSCDFEVLLLTDKEIYDKPEETRGRILSFVCNHFVVLQEKPKKLGRHGASYCLEVEDNHNFFANDVLVSNSHRLGSAFSWQAIANMSNAEYRVGLSAYQFSCPENPYGNINDMRMIALTGELVHKVPTRFLISLGLSCEPIIYRITVRSPYVHLPPGDVQWADTKKSLGVYTQAVVKHPRRNEIIRRLAVNLAKGPDTTRVLLNVFRQEHGRIFVRELGKLGIPCYFNFGGKSVEYFDGEDSAPAPISEEDMLQKFVAGEFKVLIGSCFVGSTKIPLLSGEEKSLTDLCGTGGFEVYSRNPQTKFLEGARAKCFKTKSHVPVMQVTLDNGMSERCTPDHLWMLRDGTYKQAKDLVAGDSLMPLYRAVDKNGYEEIYQPEINFWVPTKRSWAKKKESASAVQFVADCVSSLNHKVVSVQPDGVDDVYDVEVMGYGNFALSSGVFVHNSVFDESVDIPCLTDIILGAGMRTPRRQLQRVGRTLRLYGKGKVYSRVWDFQDNHCWVTKHQSNLRFKAYESEGYIIVDDIPDEFLRPVGV